MERPERLAQGSNAPDSGLGHHCKLLYDRQNSPQRMLPVEQKHFAAAKPGRDPEQKRFATKLIAGLD
jgi:hypothetical protein